MTKIFHIALFVAIACVFAVATQRKLYSQEAKAAPCILLLAGTESHGYAAHEHNATVHYLAELLEKTAPVTTRTIYDAAPGEQFELSPFDCLVVYSDGNESWPLIGYADLLRQAMEAGKGFVFLHYATLPLHKADDEKKTATLSVESEFVREATGGVYQYYMTSNPFFIGRFTELVDHPITRGVKPFEIYDEWYFHPRLAGELSNDEAIRLGSNSPVVPILVTIPPNEVKQTPDDRHSGNALLRGRLGEPEIVAWSVERPDGGRGFGFTGGDCYWNLAQNDYRKILVNGILWAAGLNVPNRGFETPAPTFDDLRDGQDEPCDLTPQQEIDIRQMLLRWNAEERK